MTTHGFALLSSALICLAGTGALAQTSSTAEQLPATQIVAPAQGQTTDAEAALASTLAQLEAARAQIDALHVIKEDLQAQETALTQKLDAMRGELNRLSGEVANATLEVDTLAEKNAGLARDVSAQEQSLEQANAAQADAIAMLDGVKAQQTNAQQQLDEMLAQKDALFAENETLEKRIRAAQQVGEVAFSTRDNALTEAENARAVMAALQLETDVIAEQLDVLVARKEAEQEALADLEQQTEAAQSRAAALTSDALTALAEATVARDAARAELAAITAELQDATEAEQAAEVAAAAQAAEARESALEITQIRRAIQSAPGLSDATDAQRTALETQLVDGVCAVDALSAVFGSANRQTLVSLIRDLGRC